ncbi:MAG: FAD binding domain-containing protein [Xanthobacteraceae bacterium]|nr:FAD binding domain-containing protein [Xanthobacteraceae bacterium]
MTSSEAPVRYVRPESVQAAIEVLSREDDAVIVAGGIVVGSLINQHLATPSVLVDIGRIKELKSITADTEGALLIGALVTHNEILKSVEIARRAPLLVHIAKDISCERLRNRGTLGGSLCTVGGQGDPATGLIALGATITLGGKASKRDMAIEDFYTDGFSTAIKADELLEYVRVPDRRDGSIEGFCKIGPRSAMDFTQITVAIALECDGSGTITAVRVGVNGLAPVALRAKQAEMALTGQRRDAIDWSKATQALQEDIRPDEDIIFSATYKRHLGAVALRRAAEDAFSSLTAQE